MLGRVRLKFVLDAKLLELLAKQFGVGATGIDPVTPAAAANQACCPQSAPTPEAQTLHWSHRLSTLNDSRRFTAIRVLCASWRSRPWADRSFWLGPITLRVSADVGTLHVAVVWRSERSHPFS
jgi:hypothetical protein